MSEVLTRREEVAAKRAALTDGRWRNREGVGMYQRSTSNALREMLSELKPAEPQPRRSKSRSKSRSPRKRKESTSTAGVTSRAGPSRVPIQDTLDEPITPASPTLPAPLRSPSKRKSIVSASLRQTPTPRPRRLSNVKSKSKSTPTTKSKQEISRANDDDEPEPTVASLLQQRRAKLVDGKVHKAPLVAPVEEEIGTEDEEDSPANRPSTSTRIGPSLTKKSAMDMSVVGGVGDSVAAALENEDQQLVPLKAKPKNRIKTIIPVLPQLSQSKTKKTGDPEHDVERPMKGKSTKVGKRRDGEQDKGSASGKAFRGKRSAPGDDQDEPNHDFSGPENALPSPPKRAKTKSRSTKPSKAKPKSTSKSKSRKKIKSTSASVESTSRSYHTARESSELPEPQDILVPLQDSPPRNRPARRRYTLMPARTEAEMADPDYDPIDCIGWRYT